MKKINMIVHKVTAVFVAILCTAIRVHGVASLSLGWRLNSIEGELIKTQHVLQEANDKALYLIGSILQNQNVLTSCTTYPAYSTGKYMIQPSKHDAPFAGYCEQNVFGGGWLVFQRRLDNSIGFYRDWNDYRDGFGDVYGEFWLGLQRLHRLTTERPHELLVELQDFDGEYSYARYDSFVIGSEKEQYMVKELGKYNGTAVDAFGYAKGKKFSTRDVDNDTWEEGHCASNYKGAWWYGHCADSNLNGPLRNNNGPESMYWSTAGYVPHVYSRMLIRQK